MPRLCGRFAQLHKHKRSNSFPASTGQDSCRREVKIVDINEIHRRTSWQTVERVEIATLERVASFNHQRLLEPIGYIPPVEAEANYYYAAIATREAETAELRVPA